MPNIITDEMGNPLISEQGAFIFDATKVNVGGVAQNEVNFTSDPQTQLDGKAPKDIVPTPSTADADKVIKVNASGNYELGEVTGGGAGGGAKKLKKVWTGNSSGTFFFDADLTESTHIVYKIVGGVSWDFGKRIMFVDIYPRDGTNYAIGYGTVFDNNVLSTINIQMNIQFDGPSTTRNRCVASVPKYYKYENNTFIESTEPDWGITEIWSD